MHAVAVCTPIIQRMLLAETRREEKQTKLGTRDQKAPCSFFVLKLKVAAKEEETSSPARYYTNVPICRVRQPVTGHYITSILRATVQ
jgi:hypothetical protein